MTALRGPLMPRPIGWLATVLACTAFATASVAVSAAPAPLALMPLPVSVHVQPSLRLIGPALVPVWHGVHTTLLDRALARFQTSLAQLGGIAVQSRIGVPPSNLVIECKAADRGFLTVGEDEAYHLSVDASGVHLTADGPAGVLDGLSTLLQLAVQGPDGLSLPYVTIADQPRFVWRGVMIDTARHFVSIPTIERQIDAMERVKLNVLHLHLSDAQGFRVESKLYPRLQEFGSGGQYYTQTQIRALIDYASDRGIRVVPEFDLPGHALSLLQAYPTLAAMDIGALPPNFDPDQAAMDPTNPATMKLVSRLYGEMAGLFPDPYFHVGGDEVVSDQWTGNPHIAAYMKAHHIASADVLQAGFEAAVQRVLARHGKIMIGWDEVMRAPIPASVVIDVWRSSKWTPIAAHDGHPVIVSIGYYLDLLEPAAEHYLCDPADPRAVGLSPEVAGKLLATDPKSMDFARDASAVLSPDDERRVLGGEAPLWSEIVSDEMLDARLWPRTAAIAERFWSQRQVRDVPDMLRRLAATQDRLSAMGLQAQASQHRMIVRLAPGEATPIAILLEAVSPQENYGLHHESFDDRSGGHPLALNGLADVAAPDPLPELGFETLTARALAGDRSVEPAMRVMLMRWRDNDAAFDTVADGNAVLDTALATSRDVRDLAIAGLHALDRLDGTSHDAAWYGSADPLIARVRGLLDQSSDPGQSRDLVVPAGLLIPLVRPVGDLVATSKRVQNSTVPTAKTD